MNLPITLPIYFILFILLIIDSHSENNANENVIALIGLLYTIILLSIWR